MRELSVFIDESGDLGEVSEYYLVSLVLHDQSRGISEHVNRYVESLQTRRLPDIPMHTGPLLNGHDGYKGLDKETRRHMLSTFRTFVQHLPFEYFCFSYRKSQFGNDSSRLAAAMKRDVTYALFEKLESLQIFDKIKIYYDNGQGIVTEVIHDAFEYVLAKEAIVYKDAKPAEYRLLQVVDYVCTIELTAIKFEAGKTTATDSLFFGTRRGFKKGFLAHLRKHRLS
jgi:hypothetical protein